MPRAWRASRSWSGRRPTCKHLLDLLSPSSNYCSSWCSDFQQLFEFQLEQFVATQSFSQAEFVAACQDALDNGDWANCKGLVEVVLSMSTYEYFVRMMVAAAAPNPFEDFDAQHPAADAPVEGDDSEFM